MRSAFNWSVPLNSWTGNKETFSFGTRPLNRRMSGALAPKGKVDAFTNNLQSLLLS